MTYFLSKLLYIIINYIEDIIISNPDVLALNLKIIPGRLILLLSKLKTPYIFRYSAKNVPAYRDFLKNNKIDVDKIFNYNQFINNVPLTDKDNYIYKYNLLQRSRYGRLPSKGNIDESAGSSGKATMWIRSKQEEIKLQKLVNFGLHYSFNSMKKNNLIVLNCWSNGPWASGVKFSQLAQGSTVVKSVGTDKINTVETIQYFGKEFEYLLCGYPPFIKEVIDYGEEVKINWRDYKVNIVTGGEGFSENWRDYMRTKIDGSNGEIYSAFGASDIDIGIGFETDFTIKIKQLAEKDVDFRKKIFNSERMPSFFGIYNPLIYNIETSNSGELVFTMINGDVWSPKIRYNIKDSGFNLSYDKLIDFIKASKYSGIISNYQLIHLPFFVVFGRSDGTISLDGANIYPNDVQDAIFKSKFAHSINSFYIDTAYTQDKSIIFKIYLELIEGEENTDKNMIEDIEELILSELLGNNKDYRESYTNNKESLKPRVELFKNNTGIFINNRNKIKNIYYKK
jgi:phenylacetate-CoA ligase